MHRLTVKACDDTTRKYQEIICAPLSVVIVNHSSHASTTAANVHLPPNARSYSYAIPSEYVACYRHYPRLRLLDFKCAFRNKSRSELIGASSTAGTRNLDLHRSKSRTLVMMLSHVGQVLCGARLVDRLQQAFSEKVQMIAHLLLLSFFPPTSIGLVAHSPTLRTTTHQLA